ncbi:Cationic amino acid transporter 1 [Forsythia ovata]|uniref:Cationic amino acid transporter 1 n=1 Tax=Forsythia ovata TaxID=205694 RepID=A0ABD1QCW8_9LAMI
MINSNYNCTYLLGNLENCHNINFTGGSFAYLRVELGDFMAFIAAGNILLEYVIGGAAVARSWTAYFATLFNMDAADFRISAHGLPEGYNELDLIAVGIIVIICVHAVLSIKGSSRLKLHCLSIPHCCDYLHHYRWPHQS